MKAIFAMIEAGGGHKAPAKAVMDALLATFPGKYETRLMDFMKDLGCTELDARHKREWNSLLAHPGFTKLGYHAVHLVPRISKAVLRANYVRPFVPYVERFLAQEKPDLIFCTHFFPAMAAIDARRRTGSRCRIISFCSDAFGVHAFWRFEGSDLYLVASEQAHASYLRCGLSPGTVEVFPYPLPGGMDGPLPPSDRVLGELGLTADRVTLLISFGGQGIGDVQRYLEALEADTLALNVIVVAGRNEALKTQLARAWTRRDRRLRVAPLGFVSNMRELLGSSDFCFIKPGVAATFEAFALRKPIIFRDPPTPSEKWNVDYAVSRGVGIRAGRSVRRFVDACRLLSSDATRIAMTRKYDQLDVRIGAEPIARRLNRILD